MRYQFLSKDLDFVKHRNKFFIFSLILLLAGTVVLVTMGLNKSIDFSSGTRVDISADHSLDPKEVEKELKAIGFEDYDRLVVSGNNKEIVTAQYIGTLKKEEVAKIKTHFNNLYNHEPSISIVSPQVGKELARNAMISILLASIGIVIYVALRFEFYFAISAIISLLHDAFLIVAVFSLLRLEVDVTFIAAVLTIIGYSINDTIVTFDRIRENVKKERRIKSFEHLAHIVNLSIVQTLTRSINTVLTVVIAAAALYFLGAPAIKNFSFALLVGLIAGTYSSLFIAAQLWLVLKNRQLKKVGYKKLEI